MPAPELLFRAIPHISLHDPQPDDFDIVVTAGKLLEHKLHAYWLAVQSASLSCPVPSSISEEIMRPVGRALARAVSELWNYRLHGTVSHITYQRESSDVFCVDPTTGCYLHHSSYPVEVLLRCTGDQHYQGQHTANGAVAFTKQVIQQLTSILVERDMVVQQYLRGQMLEAGTTDKNSAICVRKIITQPLACMEIPAQPDGPPSGIHLVQRQAMVAWSAGSECSPP